MSYQKTMFDYSILIYSFTWQDVNMISTTEIELGRIAIVYAGKVL